MQSFSVNLNKDSKPNLRRAVACIVVLSALWVGGCGVTSKPNGLGSQNTPSTPGSESKGSTPANSSAIASQLVASPTSVNFGSVNLGNAAAQLISLTNTGSASVTIASVSASTGFGTTTGSNITLMPNQSVNIYVSFQPNAAGKAAGLVTIASTAVNSLLQIGLAGAGTAVQPDQHSVVLDWSPSASNVAGYNVYRGSAAGGPYAKVNSAVDPVPDFNDAGVATSATYYYVVTSVDNNNMESAFSNQVVVSIP